MLSKPKSKIFKFSFAEKRIDWALKYEENQIEYSCEKQKGIYIYSYVYRRNNSYRYLLLCSFSRCVLSLYPRLLWRVWVLCVQLTLIFSSKNGVYFDMMFTQFRSICCISLSLEFRQNKNNKYTNTTAYFSFLLLRLVQFVRALYISVRKHIDGCEKVSQIDWIRVVFEKFSTKFCTLVNFLVYKLKQCLQDRYWEWSTMFCDYFKTHEIHTFCEFKCIHTSLLYKSKLENFPESKFIDLSLEFKRTKVRSTHVMPKMCAFE